MGAMLDTDRGTCETYTLDRYNPLLVTRPNLNIIFHQVKMVPIWYSWTHPGGKYIRAPDKCPRRTSTLCVDIPGEHRRGRSTSDGNSCPRRMTIISNISNKVEVFNG